MISPVKIWRRQKSTRRLIGLKGKIITWTKIYIAGINFKKNTPYPVILVELENGQRAFGQLVDYSEKDLAIDRPVVSVLRKVRDTSDESVIAYGVKFKPLQMSSST